MSACDSGEVEDAVSGVCVPAECGTDRWRVGVADTLAVYVSATASPGGDGSEQAPLASIQDGLDLAAESGTSLVVVEAGTYDQALWIRSVHSGVELRGRCLAMVEIDLRVDGQYPGIQIGSLGEGETTLDGPAGAILSGLTLSGSDNVGLSVFDGTVEVSDLAVTDCAISGIYVTGATTHVILEDVEIRDTRVDKEGNLGYGLNVFGGAAVEMSRSIIDGNRQLGVMAVNPGTSVTLDEVQILNTRPDNLGRTGVGIQAWHSAELNATRCVLDNNYNLGVHALQAADIHLEDVVIRNSRWGGLLTTDGAVSMISSTIEDNQGFGFAQSGSGYTLLQDVVIRGTIPVVGNERPYGELAIGGVLVFGGQLTAVGCSLEQNADVGLRASGPDAQVTLAATTIRDTLPRDAKGIFSGWGLLVNEGASVTAQSVTLDGNREFGAVVWDEGSELRLADADIRGTLASDYLVSAGVASLAGGTANLSAVTVSDGQGPGLYTYDAQLSCTSCDLLNNTFAGAVAQTSTLELTGAQISGTSPDERGEGGVGVYVDDRYNAYSTCSITRSVVEGSRYAAVYLRGAGEFTVSESELVGCECEDVDADEHGYGNALFLSGDTTWNWLSASLDVSQTTIRGASGAGVFLDEAEASLDDNFYLDNEVDVVQQHCSGLDDAEITIGEEGNEPTAELCTLADTDVELLTFSLD